MWYGTHVSKPNGEWNRVAENMMINFAETGSSLFCAISALERGELKSKGGGKKTIHNNGSDENVELILRTIISANQLSIQGAVADLRNDLDADYAESEICESLVIATEIANTNTTSQSSQSAQRNLLQDYFKKFAEDQKISRLSKDSGFLKKIEKKLFFITIEEGSEILQSWDLDQEFGFVLIQRSVQSWMRNSILTKVVIALMSWSNHCLETKQPHGFALWTVSTNTLQKRQRKYRVRMWTNPWRRPNQT